MSQKTHEDRTHTWCDYIDENGVQCKSRRLHSEGLNNLPEVERDRLYKAANKKQKDLGWDAIKKRKGDSRDSHVVNGWRHHCPECSECVEKLKQPKKKPVKVRQVKYKKIVQEEIQLWDKDLK